MKILLLILTLVFTTNTLNAQLQGQAKIDSLLKELPKMKEDTNGVNLLSDLSFNYYHLNIDEGIKYGKQGLKLAKKISWKTGVADCYNSMGLNYSSKSDYPNALECLKSALKIREELKDEKKAASIIHNIGNIYSSQSDYPKALEYYLKALRINEKPGGNEIWLANNLSMIGSIYRHQLNYEKGLEYAFKGMEIFEKLGDKQSLMFSYNIIGVLYYYWEKYPQALEFYTKSLELNKIINNPGMEGVLLGNIGLIHFHQQNYQKAQKFLEDALTISFKNKEDFFIAFNSMSLGNLYKKLSQDSIIKMNSMDSKNIWINKELNLNKAIEYYIESNNYFKKIGDLYERSKCLLGLSEAYEQKQDYKNQIKYYKLHISLKDSIYNEKNIKKISTLENARNEDLKQLRIEAQEKEKQLIIYSAIIVVFLIALILFIVINSSRKSEKLLLNVLPAKIAKRLKAKEHPIADHFDGASIMFVDIVGFTSLSSDTDPKRIVSVLNDIFTIFDKLADKHGLEKIKTIGDAYMAVAGIPEIQEDHSKRTAQMALDIKREMKDFKTSDGTELKFRIGIDCGAVVAGVIGEKKFIYDLWSDAVNTASRMESTGESGQIQITDNFKTELEKFEGNWNFTLRGEFEIKGKGLMKTYYLD